MDTTQIHDFERTLNYSKNAQFLSMMGDPEKHILKM